MIITEQRGVYTRTYSDTHLIRSVGEDGIVCAEAWEPHPQEWAETDIPRDPSPDDMHEALTILGVEL